MDGVVAAVLVGGHLARGAHASAPIRGRTSPRGRGRGDGDVAVAVSPRGEGAQAGPARAGRRSELRPVRSRQKPYRSRPPGESRLDASIPHRIVIMEGRDLARSGRRKTTRRDEGRWRRGTTT